MAEIRAVVRWAKRSGEGICMMPFTPLDFAEKQIASMEAEGYFFYSMEKAVFPADMDACTSAYFRDCHGLEVKVVDPHRRPPKRNIRRVKKANILHNGRVIGVARTERPEGFARPYWTVDLYGRTFIAGCEEGLMAEIVEYVDRRAVAVSHAADVMSGNG